jgi:transcriptional regulator with PAS, ATPase and Fis domain
MDKSLGSLQSVAALEDDLKSCLKVSQFLFEDKSLEEFLALLLEECIKRTRADRGSIFLVDRDARILRGWAMTGVDKPSSFTMRLDQGIVGEVVSKGLLLNIQNAYLDARFFREVDNATGYKTKAILCAPIISASLGNRREIWGAIEVLNPKNKECFEKFDERTLNNILTFAALRLKQYSQIKSLLETKANLEDEVARVKGFFDETNALARMVGSSPPMEKLKQMIWAAAPFDSNVLITGESGTGKELVAQCLHGLSPRRNKPFVAINCAALPESLQESELFGIEGGVATGVTRRSGKIEAAHGGTLFLDEVAEMSLSMQAKLLRALQEKEVTRVGGHTPIKVDTRIICATHRDLTHMVSHKTFREDLYYRLHVLQINVAPLRERTTDVPTLANHFLAALNKKYRTHTVKTFASETLALLSRLEWPGNVRQLQNEVERLYVVSGAQHSLIEASHLTLGLQKEEYQKSITDYQTFLRTGGSNPAEAHPTLADSTLDQEGNELGNGILKLHVQGKSLSDIINTTERILVKSLLVKHQGNKTRIAEELGISREGLRKMLARWGESDELLAQ